MKILQKELSKIIGLASPLVAALLSQIAMEVVNSLMLGRLGADALAAGGLGIAIFFILLVVSTGIFSASSILIARNFGSGNYGEISKILDQSLYLALILAIPTIVLLWHAPHFLLAIGEQAKIVSMTAQFLHALAWGMLPLLGYLALREFVSALSFTRIIMFLALCAAPLTAVGNYILMYGKLGLPALGIAGIGYSTAAIQWFLLISMLVYIFKNNTLKAYFVFHHFQAIHWQKLWSMIKLGAPVSITMALEAGMFSTTTMLMGYFGAHALAAHQIALQCTTLAFMFPLGISQATAIRVGQAMGEGSVQRAKSTAYAGLTLGVGVAFCTAAIFFSFPKTVIHIFINTHNPKYLLVVSHAASFLKVMALFQLLDAVQVIMSGVLRGLKDTFVPMWLGLVSYWVSGIAIGYYLAFDLNLGGVGLWWGLGIGVGVSGALLYGRFRQRIQHELKKLPA